MGNIVVKSRKPIFTSKYFNLIEANIAHNDKEATFHYVDRRPFVLIIPLSEKNEVYLLKHYRYVEERDFIEICSGVIEQHEDSLDAAKRELKEETGLTAQKWTRLSTVYPASSFTKSNKTYYLAQELTLGDKELEFSEEIDIIKMPIEEAIKKILDGEIDAEKTVVGVLLVYTLLQKNKI